MVRKRFRLRFSRAHLSSAFARCWRLLLVSVLIVSSLLVAESELVPEVYAASHTSHISALPSSTHPPHHRPVLAPVHPLAPVTSHQKPFAAFPHVSQSSLWDGLGQLPFFTYITHPITSPTCTCGKVEVLVNVANGNLLVHSVEMQIHGTGLDLSIEAYYNSLASSSTDLGQNWVLSVGHDVRLDLSNPTSGVTLYGPSGYSAFFVYAGMVNNLPTFTDAPGINATVTANADGTYTLSFHRTGEQWIFGTNSHLSAMKDKNGHTISIAYDSDHDVTSITDTQGRIITFKHNTVFGIGHDPEGQVTKILDPTSQYVTYGYTNNQLTSETNLDGKQTQYAYTGSDLTQITDAKGHITKIAYDSSHRVTSITDPQQGVTQFTYNSNATVVTDALTHTRTYNYNGNGQVISVVNANGVTVSNTTYSGNYDMASYQDALTNSTSYSYSQDGNNNLIGTTDANNATTSLRYPSVGALLPYYPTGSEDSQSNYTSYVYDSSGNLTSSTNTTSSPNVSLTYTYYTSGVLQGLIHMETDADGSGHVTTYGYDAEGNLTSITPPSPQQAITYTYDGLSRVITQTDGNGNVTTYTYTPMNRIKSVSYKDSSSGNTSSVSYTYDAVGNPTSIVDSVAGTTSFSYDTLNRQTKKTLPDTSTVTYTYDAVGNLLTLTDAGGKVTYGYDNLNEMTSLTEPNGSGGTETLTFGYDNNGRRTSVSYPDDSWDGSATYYIYDKGGRLQEVTRYGEYSDDEDYVYSYSNPGGSSGNYTSLRYSVNSYLNTPQNTGQQWTTSYSYDPLNRLTKATTSTVQGTAYATTSTYQYDANGNRTSGSTSANSGTSILNPYNNTYQYDSANQLTKVNSGTICTNDGAGNQTGCGSSYKETYNPRNQTTSMSSPNGSLSLGYTGTDSTERTTAGSTSYTYNLLGLGTEKDASGNVIAYTRDSLGNLIGERTKGGNYFYLFDGLGSVVSLIAAKTDAVVSNYIYDPYGVVEQQSGTQYNPWQFAGGYYDATTLYEKFGTRYYDRFGRWTQQDPMASANPYTYVGDDPVNNVDPSGMYTTQQWLSTFGQCFASAVEAPLLAISGVISAIGVIGASIAIIAGLTAAAIGWAWVALIGAATFLGVVAACAAFATLHS